VKEVIKVMQNSPTAAYLRECSFHERMMLAAVIKCVKREGVEEVKWGDVRTCSSFLVLPFFKAIDQHHHACQVQHQHRIYIPILGDTNQELRPSSAELTQVLDSLLASRAMLTEDGGLATRKSESERRVVLNLEQAEVERILGDVGGMRWKNALSV
jgi:origin recognition complex subunit 1